MNPHLALIKTTEPGFKCTDIEVSGISDMNLIFSQALLMDAGSLIFKAIKSGELADILAGMVALAYAALQALSFQDHDVEDNFGERRQEYQLLAIMRLLSEKIHHCSSGTAKNYSELYHLCEQLSSGFLNADFDKAFNAYHGWYKDNESHIRNPAKSNLPDLTDCFYE